MAHSPHGSAHRTPPAVPLFPAPGHNHEACMTATLARARAAFDTHAIKWTRLRETVLCQIAASHHAIGAYDIIARLAEHGTRLSPISVYRAIQSLMAAGIVHRLESRNAYFVCRTPHSEACENVVFACLECGTVAETQARDAFAAVDTLARRAGFAVTTRLTEVTGRCAHCAKAACP